MTTYRIILAFISTFALCDAVIAQSWDIKSPDGKVKLTVARNETTGALSYEVKSGETPLLETSPLGIVTDKAEFTKDLTLIGSDTAKVDETYTLPQGKVSTYHNNANELTVHLKKGAQAIDFIFRAYNEGIAFRYAIPGSGPIQITREASGFRLAGQPALWGQGHPNNYGYESNLGQIDGQAFSFALLCEMEEGKNWVLLGQAATYGSYCIPHLKRTTQDPSLFNIAFPIQQTQPVKTVLPFASPWRVAVISMNGLATVVEQTLFENLNAPTEPQLVDADWIKPGRATFDWFAGDKANWKGWIDFVSEMGWEYHLVDDGWQRYIKDPVKTTAYAESKGCAIMAWQNTSSMFTPDKQEAVLKHYSKLGIKGAKVDFFDRLPDGKVGGADYEDTQMGIQVRESITKLAMKYKMQLVFHGCAIPTGERRRWPHVLGTEAVKGQEGSPSAPHDNCIAFIRNPLGPVDYSPVWFGKNKKTDAYQLATSIVFESGFLIFADLHKDYLKHPSKEFLKKISSTWDEVRFLDGYPASHTVIARRKGKRWFVGGITCKSRTVDLTFNFLDNGAVYSATIFKDQKSGLAVSAEKKELRKGDALQLQTLDRGGFAIMLEPK